MNRETHVMKVNEYTAQAWENAFTVFVEGVSVHGKEEVERAIKIMNAIDKELAATLINTEVEVTPEVTEVAEEVAVTNENTITVYHGTHQELTTFVNRPVKNYDSIGTYFTSNKEYARSLYGKNVIEANITLNNPLVVNNVNDLESFDKVFYDNTLTNLPFAQINKLLLDTDYINALKSKLINKGYDGIIFKDSSIDLAPNEEAHTVYIVFNADNIQMVTPKLMKAS